MRSVRALRFISVMFSDPSENTERQENLSHGVASAKAARPARLVPEAGRSIMQEEQESAYLTAYLMCREQAAGCFMSISPFVADKSWTHTPSAAGPQRAAAGASLSPAPHGARPQSRPRFICDCSRCIVLPGIE